LAKAEKYRVSFKTGDNYEAQVSFFYEGYVGAITTLIGGARPFVLKEFNTDEDLFKPIRPQLAEMEILATPSSVTLDDFLAASDTDIEVRFYFGSLTSPYWIGYLLQQDFQEEWVGTNHIIKVTASDGFGMLKFKKLSNNGAEVTGKKTPFDIIQYATQGLPIGWTTYNLINNLYYDGMSTTLPATSLSQAYIDSKTFEETPTLYSDNYKVLEQINAAFNQTIFMYDGGWFLLRMEELYTPTTTNLRGYNVTLGTTTTLSRRYDASVGKTRSIKLISPEAMRFIRRTTKEDIVRFPYERFSEIIPNTSFARGALIRQTSTSRDYAITDWSLYEGTMQNFGTPAVGNGYIFRKETFLSITSPLIDNYVVLTQTYLSPVTFPAASQDFLMRSQSIEVYPGEKITFDVDTQFAIDFTTKETMKTAYIRLVTSTKVYTLSETGKWIEVEPFPSPFTDASLNIVYNDDGNTLPLEWNTVSVESEAIPDRGQLSIWLVTPREPWASGQVRYFKGLKFEIINRFDGFQEGLTGIQSKFTKSNELRVSDESEIYFDDSFSSAYRGALYKPNQTDLTDNKWYRFRYSGERQGFRKQNAIARWSHNRYNRTKLDANFFGLFYEVGASTQPIGLMNTVVFVDDDPNKVYAIVNLNEIDFASATWSATLEEVWDNARDAGVTAPKSATVGVKLGTYDNTYTPVAKIPFSSSNNVDFIYTEDSKIYYKGASQLSVNITVSITGTIILTTGTFPVNTEFRLKKNGTTIFTQTILVNSNPQPLSVNLNPSSAVAINPNDYFEIEYLATVYGTLINTISFDFGTFQTSSYTIQKALDYDPYSERYTYT
jgi:hypothetical protein